ncbi:MAG TPA: phosphoesterase [Campylobacterales bacterium]|nr:phosphoesterase [Campylobacterales bacterium]
MFIQRRLYHLSHIDLDGYSCQLLTSYIFQNRKFYNANYGKEVLFRIDEIFEDIEKLERGEKVFLLITDLNLTIKEAEYIDSKVKQSPYNIHLQLLDHHITGAEVAEEFSWYYMNTDKSATKITFEFIQKNFPFPKESDKIAKFVEAVNAFDIWLQDSEHFEYGKVMMRLIGSARELARTMFAEEDTYYKLELLKGAMEIYNDESIEKKHIYLDDQIHYLKKRFFRGNREDDTIDNLMTNYIVELLEKRKEELTIRYKGYKGVLTYMIGSISVIGNAFLTRNSDYCFFLDVSNKGNISLRANGDVDVAVIAQEIGNGGGHSNASGGRVKGMREFYRYGDVKKFIENLLIEKEYTTDLLLPQSESN